MEADNGGGYSALVNQPRSTSTMQLNMFSYTGDSFFFRGLLGIKVKVMLDWDSIRKLGPMTPLPDIVITFEMYVIENIVWIPWLWWVQSMMNWEKTMDCRSPGLSFTIEESNQNQHKAFVHPVFADLLTGEGTASLN
ncbi:hypothetical protein F2Q69_00049321 [Brassica cretica]|uniref:Uncharacterized protein n=1 Tax=Brassica cretica TaxID=69181 RepID=A0A8S9PRV7_BRACR|nr:hypothetical protein F2Q69_00049321 [Brassica cretica]